MSDHSPDGYESNVTCTRCADGRVVVHWPEGARGCKVSRELFDQMVEQINAGRWVPVAERLPEIEQRVLGFWMWHGGAVQSVRGAVGGWLDDDENVTTPPTHWMPMPPRPPGGETW